jgi:hypothetical protein
MKNRFLSAAAFTHWETAPVFETVYVSVCAMEEWFINIMAHQFMVVL